MVCEIFRFQKCLSSEKKVIVWLSEIARGIKNILSYAHKGIKSWEDIKTKIHEQQLQLKL